MPTSPRAGGSGPQPGGPPQSAGLPQSAGPPRDRAPRDDPAGDGAAAVELARLGPDAFAIRNLRHPAGPALMYTRAEISAFITGAKNGEFDDLLEEPGAGAPRAGG